MNSTQSARVFVLAIITAITSTACQKNDSNKILPPVAGKSTVQSLAGKDPATVLKAKYESAVLNCTLRLVHAAAIPADSTPDVTFTFDLLKATSGPGVVTLRAEKDDLTVTANLTFGEISIFDTTLFDSDGGAYSVQRSPYFKYNLELSESQASTGSDLGGAYRSTNGATERIAFPFLDMTRKLNGDETPYREQGECVIATNLKPEFANQFKPIQVK